MQSTTPALIPRKIRLSTYLKFFTREGGISDGSEMEVEFDIPEGMDQKDLTRAVYEQKERMDITVLVMERLKGSITDVFFKGRKDLLKSNYDKLLKRANHQDEQSAD